MNKGERLADSEELAARRAFRWRGTVIGVGSVRSEHGADER
jgi:hypothetical protein